MSSLHSMPPVIITLLECLGLGLLAYEVWTGHEVERINEEVAPSQRLQYLYTTQDYRGFWLEWRLQNGQRPEKAREMVGVLTTQGLHDAVEAEWSGVATDLSRAIARLEKYTAPAVRTRRKILLWTGTSLVIIAALLHLFHEPAGKHENGGEVVHERFGNFMLSAVHHQLSPVETGRAESREDGCRLVQKLNSEGANVALVIGRHDPRPLSAAATKRFGSNLGLAQRRAEAVASLIATPKGCLSAKPVETVSIAVPNERLDRAASLDEQRRPDVIGLRVIPEPRK